MVCHQVAKFGSHRYCGSRDIIFFSLSRDLTIPLDQTFM